MLQIKHGEINTRQEKVGKATLFSDKVKFKIVSTEGEDYITIKEQIYDGYITSIKMKASKSMIALWYETNIQIL